MQIIRLLRQELISQLKQQEALAQFLNDPLIVSDFSAIYAPPIIMIGSSQIDFVENETMALMKITQSISLVDDRSHQQKSYEIVEQLVRSLNHEILSNIKQRYQMLKAEVISDI